MKYACDMFHSEAIHYVLIHSYDVPYQPNEVIVSSVLETLKNEVGYRLEQEEQLLKTFLKNEESLVSKRMGVGSVVDIIKYNEDLNPDFVIMGIRSEKRSASGFLIGSNTMQVMRRTDAPVLAIPEGCSYRKLQHIVFGTDLQSISPEVVLPLKNLLKRTEAQLTVVHVGEITEETRKESIRELKEILGDRMSSFEQVEAQAVAEGLEKTIRVHQADLLVLIDRKRNFFQRIFHKSVTNEISWKSDVPMLILHD